MHCEYISLSVVYILLPNLYILPTVLSDRYINLCQTPIYVHRIIRMYIFVQSYIDD